MAPSSQSVGRVGWDMLRKPCGDADAAPQTVVLSPLSITIALGMLAGAADDSKKRDLCTKLGLQSANDLDSVLRPLHSALCGGAKDGPLALANAVFTDDTVALYPAYRDFLRGFNAESTRYPDLARAAEDMNTWISDNTRGLIRRMLSPAALQHSHLALVNAIGFKGTWQMQFERGDTRKEKFCIARDEQTEVDMMFQRKQKIASLETPSYKAVRLPYTLPESYPSTSLFAYLPAEGTLLSTVLDEIATSSGNPVGQFAEVKYDEFGFPRFDIDSKFSLVDTLEELGYPVGGAYAHMAEGQNQVQTMLHQAYVKVDEEGTEAAAATAVIMARSMILDPKVLLFNRPFIFAIASDKPDAILFAGIYSGK
ncbi:proteinase inhibitor I4 [Metarhizium album ARSEF 1941]|uniref:Proteinase inhibitor I4 n=1 Tax=Metarhizium album (strain ARSEF 1941) TaxID=1081103 RepID=A0A0B2WPQ8_METAS|nr:proteinase inhibitor I4 [Metarhizium album ARSEF 1941]KHN96003.1 proteinase inhibitor I4 [Metarhizium album ARSEF 1941]